MNNRYFHVWFSTKGRKPALADEEINGEIQQQMRAAAARGQFELRDLALAVDHVHALICLRDDQHLESAMQRLKGASSRIVFEKFPDLRFDMRGTLWQKGHGSRLVPVEEVTLVSHYSRSQLERPLRHEN